MPVSVVELIKTFTERHERAQREAMLATPAGKNLQTGKLGYLSESPTSTTLNIGSTAPEHKFSKKAADFSTREPKVSFNRYVPPSYSSFQSYGRRSTRMFQNPARHRISRAWEKHNQPRTAAYSTGIVRNKLSRVSPVHFEYASEVIGPTGEKSSPHNTYPSTENSSDNIHASSTQDHIMEAAPSDCQISSKPMFTRADAKGERIVSRSFIPIRVQAESNSVRTSVSSLERVTKVEKESSFCRQNNTMVIDPIASSLAIEQTETGTLDDDVDARSVSNGAASTTIYNDHHTDFLEKGSAFEQLQVPEDEYRLTSSVPASSPRTIENFRASMSPISPLTSETSTFNLKLENPITQIVPSTDQLSAASPQPLYNLMGSDKVSQSSNTYRSAIDDAQRDIEILITEHTSALQDISRMLTEQISQLKTEMSGKDVRVCKAETAGLFTAEIIPKLKEQSVLLSQLIQHIEDSSQDWIQPWHTPPLPLLSEEADEDRNLRAGNFSPSTLRMPKPLRNPRACSFSDLSSYSGFRARPRTDGLNFEELSLNHVELIPLDSTRCKSFVFPLCHVVVRPKL